MAASAAFALGSPSNSRPKFSAARFGGRVFKDPPDSVHNEDLMTKGLGMTNPWGAA